MTDRSDPWLERVLARVQAPPPASDFEHDLWQRIAAHQRREARLWRASSVALAVLALAAVSAASVMALTPTTGSSLDRTVTCQVPMRAGIPVVDLSGSNESRTTISRKTRIVPGLLWLGTDSSMQRPLIALQSRRAGYDIDQLNCRNTAKIASGAARLPRYGTYLAGGVDALRVSCFSGLQIQARIRATLSKTGVPTAGSVTVRTGKASRPLAYVEWKPKSRVDVFLADGCHDR